MLQPSRQPPATFRRQLNRRDVGLASRHSADGLFQRVEINSARLQLPMGAAIKKQPQIIQFTQYCRSLEDAFGNIYWAATGDQVVAGAS
jgi:hypothetical protein